MKTLNFKVILAAAILLVSFSLTYYFLFFLPSASNKEHTFETTRQCSEDGKKIYDEMISKIEAEPGDTLFGKKYEIYFSEKLNKCLLGYEYSYGGVTAKYVQDVYSYEKIISYFKNGESEGEMTLNKYESKFNELFDK